MDGRDRMYIADLHIHSRFSMAVSKDCRPEQIGLWAARKGIRVVGTGDFTHPGWREELKEKLKPAEDGFYVLKEDCRIRESGACQGEEIRFVLTGEISTIYKKNDRTRKVHSLILLPDMDAADRLADRLDRIGNIRSDGRPILGLDCRDLLEIMLDTCPEAEYIPAHIWTPHFSVLGAFSGFGSMEECFGDLSPHIHALETGLSSDPGMNRRVSSLDRYHLISGSDAHSPARLGREASVFDTEFSYSGLAGALRSGNGLCGTIEFFPEEGKYHMDGHRKCGIRTAPEETKRLGGRCPVCGKKITVGVCHRIEELADRPEGYVHAGDKPYESLVPLPEVISAAAGYKTAGKRVQKQYFRMLELLGSEFEILRNIPEEEIKKAAGERIAGAIGRLRRREVKLDPGFDGQYGTVGLFETDE